MEKEFEVLSSVRQFVLKYARFENVTGDNANGSKTLIELNIIKQALTELQAIKEAKPSEALECLVVLEDCASVCGDYSERAETIRNALLKAQEQEKVLEIIIKKGIDIGWLRQCKTVEEYNYHCEAKRLTQEEFELLKRWCEKCQK